MFESIDIRDKLAPGEFHERYVAKGMPVLIRGLAEGSVALREWSLDFFGRRYGDTRVTVTGTPAGNRSCKLGDYIAAVKRDPLSAGYLRDWTIAKLDRGLFGHLPKLPHFDVDFLKHTDATRDMFKAIFIGPEGSSTLMHIDVWRSHAWMLVLNGSKRWVMISPEDMHASGLLRQTAASEFHTKVIARLDAIQHYEFLQHRGDLVYIPQGWWHFVENVETSVAVTYNYIDAFCIEAAMTDAARKVNLLEELVKAQCAEFSTEDSLLDANKATHDFQRKAMRSFLQARAKILAESAENLRGLAERL